MKKVLVTGSRGLLGSACVRLLSQTYIVLQADCDLRNHQEVYWMFQRLMPDYVIHCAAKVGGVKANRDNPVAFIEDNIAINSNVIAACHAFGIQKLVNIGTSCMFPKNAPVPVKESSFQNGPLESDVEAYASAKILAYMTCKAYKHQHGSRFVTCCPANLYGPNDSYGEEAHVIPALIRKASEAATSGTKMKVWGDGSAVREFLHADDAASAIKLVLENYESSDLISIGSGVGTSIKELAETIAKAFSVNGIEWVPSEPTGIQKKTFDISKLKALGWEQRVGLKYGISSVCSDYKHDINIRKR